MSRFSDESVSWDYKFLVIELSASVSKGSLLVILHKTTIILPACWAKVHDVISKKFPQSQLLLSAAIYEKTALCVFCYWAVSWVETCTKARETGKIHPAHPQATGVVCPSILNIFSRNTGWTTDTCWKRISHKPHRALTAQFQFSTSSLRASHAKSFVTSGVLMT